jgi:hypothetical protein
MLIAEEVRITKPLKAETEREVVRDTAFKVGENLFWN